MSAHLLWPESLLPPSILPFAPLYFSARILQADNRQSIEQEVKFPNRAKTSSIARKS
jgi:hypothetical protein